MARFGLNRADEYGGQGGAGFFSFKGRKDAHIRFLYNDVNDVEGYAVHEIELDGKKRYVDCLWDGKGDRCVCPLCREGYFTQVKYLVPVYDEDEGVVYTWDRGKAFGRRLEKLFAKYAEEAPLCATCFTVKREINEEGYPYYTFTPDYTDDTELCDLPDFQRSAYGRLVLQKSAEEMEEYLEYGDFWDDEAC